MSSSPIVIGLAIAADQRDPAHWIALGRAAEEAGITFLLIDEPRARRTGGPQTRLDAGLIASLLAARTSTLGLVPAFRVTGSEPFHISKAVATIDHVSAWQGPARAGWLVDIDTDPAAAAAVGRREAPTAADAWAEAAEAADVVQRLWDSWEDDAEIRDRDTGRFIDRQKLHHIDFAGDHFSVRGPSITPRPPQGQPVTFVRNQPGSEPVHDFADVLLVQQSGASPTDASPGAGPVVLTELEVSPADDQRELLAALHASGQQDGSQGVVLSTAAPLATLEVLRDVLTELRLTELRDTELRDTGRPAAPDPLTPQESRDNTLRARLGLPHPTNRYADRPEVLA